jgi:NAD(P)-dependent dehydrogenase (short-subunit alcohol dehydrogenase family)
MIETHMEGKTAFVTGGGSGIGRAACLAFGRERAKVVVADVNEKGGKETVKLIKEAGGEAKFIKLDVSDAQAVEKAINDMVNEYGTLDYAFNNAGVPAPFHNMGDYPLDEFQKVINVNLMGVVYCMKYELQVMDKQGSGAIVNNSSILGEVGFGGVTPYTAAKHGVIGLTREAAIEYAPQGIRINAVCPGFIDTSMLKDAGITTDKEAQKEIEKLHPMNRLGKAEEIAETVLWLCTEKASFITGQAIEVDGGYTVR